MTTEETSPFVCASLMCHAPIVVPAVGGARGEDCASSTAAMAKVARDMVAHDPDVLVVLSPHTPRLERGFSVTTTPRVVGDLSRFGAPEARVDLPNAASALAGIDDLVPVDPGPLDHGAMVPLWFLWDAGWRGDTVVSGFPWDPSADERAALGRALAAAARAGKGRWALLASGDMSHRLTPDAPSGFDARAAEFDAFITDHVRAGDLEGAARVEPGLRERAGEDVVDSLDIARAAVGARSHPSFESYEGPFGVGYLVAMLHAERADAAAADQALLHVAESAVDAYAEGTPFIASSLPDDPEVIGAFVTLRTPRPGHEPALRGCVGRLERGEKDLSRTVAELAVSAAADDPRFPAVTASELPLHVELSLLGPSEPCEMEDLDATRYGVSVRAGRRSGVLLPEVVDDNEEQVRIALSKAGISPSEPFELRRFRARKVKRA
jgi:AMMECR1 domain-containing protein/aromatic ring-opening dioxygenase catalytic subunit (LigB family)